jgi:hypothetical protein
MSARTGPERPPRSTATAVLVVLTWCAAMLPTYVQALTGTKREVTVAAYDGGTALAQHAAQLFSGLLIAYCLLVVVPRMRDLPTDRRLLLAVCLLPWCYFVLRDLYLGTHVGLTRLVFPLVAVTLWVLRVELRALRLVGWFTGLLVVVTYAMVLLAPERAFYVAPSGALVRAEKQVFADGLLTGPFNNPNTLGQVLALGACLVFLVSRSRLVNLAFYLATGVAVVWSASRSSMFAFAVSSLVCVIALAARKEVGRKVVGLVGLGLAVLVVGVPVLTSDPQAFSERGRIWAGSLESLHGHRLLGLGTTWYRSIADYHNDLISLAFHGHNLYVNTLVTGGIVGVACLGAWLLAAWRSASRAYSAAGFGVVASCCALGVLEVPVNMADSGALLFAAQLPLLIVALGRSAAPGAEDPGAEDSGVETSRPTATGGSRRPIAGPPPRHWAAVPMPTSRGSE